MPVSSRLRLRELYCFRCGYCGVTEADVGAQLTVDHYQPLSRGGSDDDENRVYACFACNNFKGDAWEPGSEKPVLHPIRDDTQLHLRLREDFTLEALTEAGNRHIQTLHLNRQPLVALRRESARREINLALLREALSEQERLRGMVDRLESRVNSLERRLSDH